MNWIAANIIPLQATVTTFLLALSFQFPMRLGLFSLAGVGLFGVGAYSSGIAFAKFHWDTWSSVAFGVVVAALVGLLLGLVVARLGGLYLAMATIAFDMIVVVLAGNLTPLTGGYMGLFGIAGKVELWHLGIIAVIVAVLFALSERGGMSRRIEAVHDDAALASSQGINVSAYRLTAFLVSGAVAGLGGALMLMVRNTTTPDAYGFGLIVVALTVAIVGGTKSWIGALIGTIIFTWLPVFLTVVGEWREVVYGVIVVLAALFFPTGIWGSILGVRKRLAERKHAGQRDVVDEMATEPDAAETEFLQTVAGKDSEQ